VRRAADERGEIRLRFLFEMALVAAMAYLAFHVGPAVLLRIKFVDELTMAANSPVEVDAATIKRDILHVAEGYGVTLVGQDLLVIRNRELKRTIVSATYEIPIYFWPSYTYVWLVKDDVQGYYY
jgi:hypothetical protein